MFRIYFGIFWSKDKTYEHTPKEPPLSMTFPLMVLALLSIVGGFIPFSDFVTADKTGFEAHLNYPLAAIAVVMGLAGIGLAWVFYKKENDLADKFANALGVFYKWTYHKFYFDEIYLFVAKKILFKHVSAPIAKFDRKYVDGTMVGIGNKTVMASKKIKGIQSGRIQDYAFAFVAGAVVFALVFIYLWTN
jgi:NADH-quinone oxidoreductase subunit L